MSQTLGEKLRQAREDRGISVSEVAEQTRISGHYLTCIENDDYRTLPGGIFNKGFVKSFAKCVGVDEQEALQDYATLVVQNDAGISDESRNYKPEVLTDDGTASSLIPTVIVAVIILGLMSWGLLKLVDYIQNQPVATPTAANSNANQGANATPASTQPPISTNEIKVEFKAVGEKISVEATVDGKTSSKEVLPEAPETYTGQESVRLKYYRGFADKVQLVINGKQVAPPAAPLKGKGVDFEVNKSNLVQIVQSGQIQIPDTGNTNANKANTNAAR